MDCCEEAKSRSASLWLAVLVCAVLLFGVNPILRGSTEKEKRQLVAAETEIEKTSEFVKETLVGTSTTSEKLLWFEEKTTGRTYGLRVFDGITIVFLLRIFFGSLKKEKADERLRSEGC